MAFTPTTWSPTERHPNLALSNSDLTASVALSSGYFNARSVVGRDFGKLYWEVTIASMTGGSPVVGVGVMNASESLGGSAGLYVGNSSGGICYYSNTGTVYRGGVVVGVGTTATSTVGDVIGVALDFDTSTVRFYKNGVLAWTVSVLPAGLLYPAISLFGAVSATANFGASALAYTPPSGFEAGFGLRQLLISGNVIGATGTPVARPVRAFKEDTGAYVGGTISNATTGAYTIPTEHIGEHTVVAYPVTGDGLPALVHHGVIPI